MADDTTKISTLPLSENLDDDDLLLVVEDGVSKKSEVGYLKTKFTEDLAPVASSGSYDDLSNRPTIPDEQIQSDWDQASSSAKDYIKNKPTIPDELADLTDDSTHRLVTDAEKSTWNGKQSALTFDDVPTDGSNNPVKSNGIYDALATKANISDLPTALADLSDDSTHRVVTDTEKTTWNAKSDFSGSYNDLTDTPTIPSDADDISYDNTESGLTADDVQGAIDEVNGNIVDVEANPSGTATGELETIKVGSTIYDIVGGEPVYGEASGAIASFSDGSANPLVDLKIAINPVQAGSGDPSPQNERPFYGWTGAEIHVADRETPHVVDNVYNVTWQTEAGEVFGGELDVTTGVLKANKAKYTIDSVTALDSGATNPNGSAFYKTIANTTRTNAICNKFKYSADNKNNMPLYSFAGVSGVAYSYYFILPSDITTKEQADTWFANNPTEIVTTLDTPITYQLTPTQVSSILGANNIWADTGDSDVVYIRDLNICINDLINRIEALEQ